MIFLIVILSVLFLAFFPYILAFAWSLVDFVLKGWFDLIDFIKEFMEGRE